MTLSDLISEFNVVVDTPGGLKELRSLILGLAVRGNLVEQDSNDEPASELLKMIEAERDRLYSEGEIRKPKDLEAVSINEYPFKIPDNWEWVRLGDCILDIYGGSTPSKSNPSYWEGDIYWASVKDLDDEKIYLTKTIDKVTKKALQENKTKFLPKDNVVVCTRMGLGKINLNKVDITINQDLKAIILPEQISQLFFYYTYRTMDIIGSGMTVSGIKQDDLINLPFQFPPFAEQHRIVQKIESLFAEVDELEEKLNQQTKLDKNLQVAINAEVQQAPDAEASKTTWTFITSNFDTLYQTPEAIDNLKKNILNEAVHGRLVPQNHNDEPASELLKRIESEKQLLYDEGEILKPKKLPPVKEDEIPFEIPESWEWARMPQIVKNKKYAIKRGPFGSAITKSIFVESGYKIYQQTNAINDDFSLGEYYINEEKFNELKTFQVKPNDLIISCSGTVGKVAEAPEWMEVGIINQALLKLSLNQNYLINDFFKVLFESYFMKLDPLEELKGTAQKNMISVKELKSLPFPLPPIEEQHRIVRRIEELFAICDRFKAQLEQREGVNDRLVRGLVKEVLEKANSKNELVQEEEILVAAEPEVEYSKQQLAFFQILCIAHALYVLKKRDMLQGEMGLAKYVYLMDRIGGINTHFKFDQNNFGPYPSNFKKRLFTRSKYFYKSGLKDYEVIDLTTKSDRLFEKETEQTDQIKNVMVSLADVFKPYKKERAHKLELMASVCWLIEKTKKTDLNIIWNEIEEWKTPKRNDVESKAELFSKEEVGKCLRFILKNEWDKKLVTKNE